MPDLPAAPAATPAPAAPSSPSTPTATPAAPAATPAPAETPGAAPSAPASEPLATPAAAPESGVPATIGDAPKQAQYPGDVEGFLKAYDAWERGEAVEAPKPAEGEVVPEVKEPEPAAADVDGDLKVEETEEPLTPESMQGLLESAPGMKEAMDANPAFKGKVFAMARENAKLRPMGEIFPSVESAKWANDTANTFVDLRTSIMSATSPEEMGGAVQAFSDQFKIVDADGKPVLDAQGNPTFGEDYDLFMGTAVTGVLSDRIATFEKSIAANKYTTPEAKDQAEMAVSALKYVAELIADNGEEAVAKPDLSALPEDVRKMIETREAALDEREKALGVKKAADKKGDLKATRDAAQGRFQETQGKTFASSIESFLKEKTEGGAYVPKLIVEYLVDDGHGGKVPVFGKDVMEQFKARIKALPDVRAKLAELQLRPVTPESEKARADFFKEVTDRELRPIMIRVLSKFQKQEKEDRDARVAKRQAGRQDARIEPQSGGGTPSAPAGLTEAQAYEKAKAQVEVDFPNLPRDKKMEKALVLSEKLMRGSA